MTKNIFSNGFIYEGVEREYPKRQMCADESEYQNHLNAWNGYLASLPHFPVTGEHSFVEGQEVVEGRDYKKENAGWDDVAGNYNIVAIPIPKPQEQALSKEVTVEPNKGRELYDFLTSPDKPFKIDVLRGLLNQYDREEISFSRFNESLNEIAYHWNKSLSTPPARTVEGFVLVMCSERLPNREGNVTVVAAEWNRLPTENAIFIKGSKKFIYDYWDEDGDQSEDITQYVTHWLEKQSLPIQGYSVEDMKRGISAGLSVGYSPNFNIDNKEREVENIFNSLNK